MAQRVLDGGFGALEKDAPRTGGPRTITDQQVLQVVSKTQPIGVLDDGRRYGTE
jgi:hypothetical protein